MVEFLKMLLAALFNWPIILSGLFWGLAISNRSIGLLAGLIVGLFWLVKSPQRAGFALLAYGAWAFLIMYLTCLYLWLSLFGHLGESLRLAAKFP